MERKRSHVSLTMLAILVGLLSQNLVVIPVMSSTVADQKNYYTPDPHAGTPPTGSHKSPPPSPSPHHGSRGGHGSTPPSHGGGGGYYKPPPSPSPPSGGNCGSSPPHDPSTPRTPSTPSTPSTPTPSTPSNPPSGGYYNSPPSSGGGSPPSPPISLTPPTTPIDPGTPSIPSPPFFPTPSPFTGTCNYWSTHPGIIWGILGWWGNLGSAFGVTNAPGFGAGISLPQALSNTRSDGLGALYREGTASYLNSLVNNKFPFTTNQVREKFVASLHSNKAAAAQAHLFKMANEGKMKPRP